MGLKGLANGVLRFDGGEVPAEWMVGGPGEGLRIIMDVVPRGKMFTPAMSLAVCKLCLRWATQFSHSLYTGMPLHCYELTRALLAELAATTFAIESMLWWTTAALDRGDLDLEVELSILKAAPSEMAWRAVDATMQLLAGQGYETALSKA